MAFCIVVSEDRTGDIVELAVISLPDHQDVIPVLKEEIAKDERFGKRGGPFRRSVCEIHAGSDGHSGRCAFRCGTACYLRRSVRMTLCAD